MTRGAKIGIIIVGGATALGLVTGLVIVPSIRRVGIRRRLDEAFADPASEAAAGGLDKFLVNEAFNPDTFKKSAKVTISRVEARERAEQVWENYSWVFGSNETAIVKAFEGLKHIHDVSKISNEFIQSYGEDLLQVLKEALTERGNYNILIGKLAKLEKD